MEGWRSQLIILIWIGLNSGWFKTAQDSPLFRRPPCADDDVPEPEAGGGNALEHVGEPPRGVRHSDAPDLPSLRKACKNTMHVACCLLGDMAVRAQLLLMSEVVRPVEVAFHDMIIQQKTRRGCAEWLCSTPRGDYDEVLCNVFAKLSDHDLLCKMRLASTSDGLEESEVQEQQFLAQKVFDLVYNLMGQRCFSNSLLESGLPWRFAGLVGKQMEHVRSTLEWCESVWLALQAAEQAALSSSWMRAFVDDLTWSRMPWVRFVLLGLAEAMPMRVESGPGLGSLSAHQ